MPESLAPAEIGVTWDVMVIGGKNKEDGLMQAIDTWCQQNEHTRILDIKYGYAASGATGYYSAMIIYQYLS